MKKKKKIDVLETGKWDLPLSIIPVSSCQLA